VKIGISVAKFSSQFGPIVYAGEELENALKTIKKLGYNGVDFFVNELQESEVTRYVSLFKSLELEVPLLVAIYLAEQGINLSDPDKKRRIEGVKKYIEQIRLAAKFESNLPIGFIRGNIQEHAGESIFRKRLSESLKAISDEAEKQGVGIFFEPINRYEVDNFNRVDSSLEFLEENNLSYIQLLIDTFHMNIEERSIEDAIRIAGDRIGHIHISDSNRLAPGMGHLDYAKILEVIKETGYNRFLSLEIFPEPSPDECAQKGIKFLKGIL